MNRRTFLNALLAGVAAVITPKPAKADFFAEMARRGLDDQTVWTPDTYKTILTIPVGRGFVCGVVGPMTPSKAVPFQFTVDGVPSPLKIYDERMGLR